MTWRETTCWASLWGSLEPKQPSFLITIILSLYYTDFIIKPWYNSNEPGHISITNGNGQAYADETDNLDWGVFNSSKNAGKGEHGTFRVFRLTDKWKVIDGKLQFAG